MQSQTLKNENFAVEHVNDGDLFTIKETAERFLKCGLTKIYEIISRRDLEVATMDGKKLITGRSIKYYIASLPRSPWGTK